MWTVHYYMSILITPKPTYILGNVVLYDLILDIGNNDLLHGTCHSLLMRVSELLLFVVWLGVSQLHL